MQDVQDLALLIRSGTALIALETHDERQAMALLTRVAVRQQFPLWSWSISEGLRRPGIDPAKIEPEDPTEVLHHIKQSRTPTLFVLQDFHPYLENQPLHVRLLKDIALAHEELGHCVVLISHTLHWPPELARLSTRLSPALPNEAQLISIIREEASNWGKSSGQRLRIDSDSLKRLVANLRGLSASDARRLARGAICDDGAITESDLPVLNRAKYALLNTDSVLHFEYDTERFEQIAGLPNLRQWLELRRQPFMAEDNDDRPRGVLLVGVQGGGKSLAARAIAGQWGVPLLRLDIGALYNKFIGETERQLRQALSTAEQLSPCVLWLDEVEKGLAVGSSDDGTSRRLLGSFLTWLAEHRSRVFIAATANDVSRLPPELLRKGRFDELFFVDLPELEQRREIFRIHLEKRGQDAGLFDLELLASTAKGFTGAEIEQAVVAGRYASHAEQRQLDTSTILAEVERTYPLSVVRRESLQALQQWASERTVRA